MIALDLIPVVRKCQGKMTANDCEFNRPFAVIRDSVCTAVLFRTDI